MTQIAPKGRPQRDTAVALRVGRWRHFEPASLEGVVAFELHGDTAVASGDPVCDSSDLPELMTRFAEYCHGRKWRFAFIGASAHVGAIARTLGFRSVNAGEDPVFDLTRSPSIGRGAERIHAAANRARVSGVVVDECINPTPAMDVEIDDIARAWLSSRKSPPMAFLMDLRSSGESESKRIFVATFEGRIIGAATCAHVLERNTLCVEELLRRPEAPDGTAELLVEEARTAAMAGGFAFSAAGASPLHSTQSQSHGSVRAAKLCARAFASRANIFARVFAHRERKIAGSLADDSFFIYQGSLLAATFAVAAAFSAGGGRPVALPKQVQWLRLVPVAALWIAALAGVFATGFAAWQFPVLTLPVREAFELLELVRFPASMMGRTSGAVRAHRIISPIVIVGLGAAIWQRRARA